MEGVFQINYNKMFEHYIQAFKFHLNDIGLSIGSGTLLFITLKDVPLILTIIGTAIGTVCLPAYFAYRRYKKQEEREKETAVIKAIKDLRELGFISQDEPSEVQRQKAIDWLTKSTGNV